jgi:hypothetical protein
MRSYLDAQVARGDFADDFTGDVSWTTVGGGQKPARAEGLRDFLIWMHTRAFDARSASGSSGSICCINGSRSRSM